MIVQKGSVTVLNPRQITRMREKKGLVPSTRPTDLATVLGMDLAICQSILENDQKVSVLDDLFNPIRDYIKTKYYTTMGLCGEISSCSIDKSSSLGVNPVIPIDKEALKADDIVTLPKGKRCVFYGEFPQTAVGDANNESLNKKLLDDELKPTGRIFTLFRDKIFKNYEEYIDLESGRKYIRIRAQFFDGNPHPLSKYGDYYQYGEIVWIEVEPIKWIIDEKNGLLIASNALVSGIEDREDYYSQFYNTIFSHYLNGYFRSQIITKGHSLEEIRSNYDSELAKKEEEKIEEEKKKYQFKKVNPFGFKYETHTPEQTIASAMKAGVAVFLHGKSSDGKSARVKQIDPDCEIVYLRNATPESLNGKSVYNAKTGEMKDIKPTWLVRLEEKCTKEPDKLHILFLDEIANALPSIQGIAFNIVLDREVNGRWKLPENARIVAAGNEITDSLAAQPIAEPLFNRFAHVYIKTTTESWLRWASDMDIHPAIYAYIAYKKGEVLRTEYTGDKPNADPRKWEMASKMLYATNNPESIVSLVGEEITKEFIEFCKREVLTLEDVLNDNYDDKKIESLDTSERYATIIGLTQVDNKDVEKVIKFTKILGAEYEAVFESMWASNDEERLEIIAEIKMTDGSFSI